MSARRVVCDMLLLAFFSSVLLLASCGGPGDLAPAIAGCLAP